MELSYYGMNYKVTRKNTLINNTEINTTGKTIFYSLKV